MNLDQTTDLVRTIRAICPAQAQDEWTPEAWHLILDDIDLRDALTAVRTIARRHDTRPLWIDPRQIRTEVHRVHDDRLDRARLDHPPTDPDAYRQWLRDTRHHIANHHSTQPQALEATPQPQEPRIANTGTSRRDQLRQALRVTPSATEI
ncbi:hypothetical protein [Acidipropionibacterium timonense]|uniref:hypothetical protein n=1 Tax=Acidipropionibacterium timonense TaxID=2161818 RepID=UPI001031C99C|nr:hypothetical protein [Acidipropionibacterium timonense]